MFAIIFETLRLHSFANQKLEKRRKAFRFHCLLWRKEVGSFLSLSVSTSMQHSSSLGIQQLSSFLRNGGNPKAAASKYMVSAFYYIIMLRFDAKYGGCSQCILTHHFNVYHLVSMGIEHKICHIFSCCMLTVLVLCRKQFCFLHRTLKVVPQKRSQTRLRIEGPICMKYA